MTTKLGAIDGGKTSEAGHNFLLSRLFNRSGVLSWDELRTKAADTPDNTVKIATGMCVIGNNNPSTSNYFYPGWITAQESVTIVPNTSGQGRVDAIVAYIDKSAVSNSNDDNPGVLKLKDVTGTPSASPTAPTASDIITSVGAGNPWILLATIVVANGFSTITNANITDQRTLVSIVKKGDWEDLPTLTRVSDTTATIDGDWTSEIGVGKPLRWLSNGTLRQNYCINSSYSSSTNKTTITIPSGYVVTANDSRFESGQTITYPAYSKSQSPAGFPTINLTAKSILVINGKNARIIGWDFVTGTGAANYISKAITYNLTFSSLPFINTSVLGLKASDPTNQGDTTGSAAGMYSNVLATSATQSTLVVLERTAANIANGTRVIFSYAIEGII